MPYDDSQNLRALACAEARALLDGAWRPDAGYCFPNAQRYPNQWLWDSCFHAIAFAALRDPRGATEIESLLEGQLADGFLPHMRYESVSINRGPLTDRSSFTQPPIFAHAMRVLRDAGIAVADGTLDKCDAALEWLFRNRQDPRTGLLSVVHPWESGEDDSARYDGRVGTSVYSYEAFTATDLELVADATYNQYGAATGSSSFNVLAAGFNALAADACLEMHNLTGDARWHTRGRDLADAIDTYLWDEELGYWVDLWVVGDATYSRLLVLDGVLPALVSSDVAHCERALSLTMDPAVFAAPYGLRFVPPNAPSFDADVYWRGPAWPQLSYVLWRAARRATFTRAPAIARNIAATTIRGALASGFAEFWNADDATSRGAIPQTWTAVVIAMVNED